MVNYNNCKIYKIEPIEVTNTNDIYILELQQKNIYLQD